MGVCICLLTHPIINLNIYRCDPGRCPGWWDLRGPGAGSREGARERDEPGVLNPGLCCGGFAGICVVCLLLQMFKNDDDNDDDSYAREVLTHSLGKNKDSYHNPL